MWTEAAHTRNIDYYNERIQTVYHQLFDDALKRYNE